MSYSRVLTLGGETFGELIVLRMEMSPIVARHDRNVSSQKGGMQRVDANGRLFLVDLDEAEHRAEEIALANLPLVAGINIGRDLFFRKEK